MEMAEAQSKMKKEQNVWYLLFLVSFTFNILMLVTHSYKLLASKRMLEAGGSSQGVLIQQAAGQEEEEEEEENSDEDV